jgi:hypothetical protein
MNSSTFRTTQDVHQLALFQGRPGDLVRADRFAARRARNPQLWQSLRAVQRWLTCSANTSGSL